VSNAIERSTICLRDLQRNQVPLTHCVPHEDPAHRTFAQLMRATRRAVLGAMMLTNPTLLEPIPARGRGVRRAHRSHHWSHQRQEGGLVNVEQKELVTIIQGEILASETFDLSQVMREATAGKATWTRTSRRGNRCLRTRSCR